MFENTIRRVTINGLTAVIGELSIHRNNRPTQIIQSIVRETSNWSPRISVWEATFILSTLPRNFSWSGIFTELLAYGLAMASGEKPAPVPRGPVYICGADAAPGMLRSQNDNFDEWLAQLTGLDDWGNIEANREPQSAPTTMRDLVTHGGYELEPTEYGHAERDTDGTDNPQPTSLDSSRAQDVAARFASLLNIATRVGAEADTTVDGSTTDRRRIIMIDDNDNGQRPQLAAAARLVDDVYVVTLSCSNCHYSGPVAIPHGIRREGGACPVCRCCYTLGNPAPSARTIASSAIRDINGIHPSQLSRGVDRNGNLWPPRATADANYRPAVE